MMNTPKPDFIQPMLCTLVDAPFDRTGWYFEPKWDGYRAIAEVHKGNIRLYSRNQQSFLNDYPPVADALKKVLYDVVLDGEIVVLDESGNSNFQLLQNWRQNRTGQLLYIIFDVLYVDGKSLM